MKKLAAGFLAITLILSASLCWAAYVIHLKDGRAITTHEYWEEGDRIKFKQYGGVIGIQKDLVREIYEIEDVPEEKTEAVKPETPSAGERADDVKKATGKKEKQEKKTDIARYKKEKTVLIEKYRKARQGLREARKAKDKTGIIAAKKQLKDAQKEMDALVRNLKKENGGLVPPWWFEPEREEQAGVPEGR